MRQIQKVQIGALIAIALTACNSSTTYKFPTDTTPLRPRTPAQEDYQAFYNSYNEFAKQNVNEIALQKDHFLFPVLSSYQSGLTILASSEGKSYQQAAKFLRTDAPDEYPLIQCLNPILINLKTNKSLKVGSSLWMIWPIPLQKPFISEMAEKTGTDIIYLGSVGLTAQRAMDRWLRQFQPEVTIKNPGFERNESITSMGVTTFTTTFQVAKTKTMNGSDAWIGKSENTAFIAWPTNSDQFFPNQKFFHLLLQGKDEPTNSTASNFTFADQTNLTESLRSLGCNQLLDGPNDFRNLSVEIIPEGDNIGIPFLQQNAAINLSISGDNPFKQSRTIGYAIIDTESEIPILIGKYTPK
ncbi:MAG: hypothetical protein ACKVQS_11525 [Fimbriimonadaceae bacterium]